jgi:hypothetical protein
LKEVRENFTEFYLSRDEIATAPLGEEQIKRVVEKE